MTDRAGGLNGAADDEPRIELGQATDVGRVRSINEDSVLCEPLESRRIAERGLFCAVADGMGGHAAGEEASSMAVQVAHAAFYGSSSIDDPMEILRLAVAEANAAVYEAGAGKTGRDHMGTTLTAAVLFHRRVVVGHVGDSRCYLVRENKISQISRDHSWVAEEVEAGRMTPEQARVNPRRNIITRALGLRPDVDVDAYEADLEPGDILVICSDGLHGLVNEHDIVSFVRRLPPADAVDALVKLANDRGGPDNISVVVARVMGDGEDEADTQRGFPVLSDAMIATSRSDFSDVTELTAPPTAPLPVQPEVADHLEAVTAPGQALPPSRPRDSAPDQPPAWEPPPGPMPPPTLTFEHDFDHEPPTPREPISDLALARAAQPQPLSGRRGGISLVVVLILLLIVGSGVGFLLFKLFISPS